MHKRVLIITYYWPPSGGAGVQRWLKFAKYLPEFGWQPVVYTVENGELPSEDKSLLKDIPKEAEVLKQPIWEPYDAYKKFVGRKKEDKINAGFLNENKKSGIADNIAVWIRGNLFIPDARKYWVSPSVKYLLNYLKEHPVDAIVSTGPPHSMHLIAMELKRRTGIKWVADFRDPWTNIDFYKDLKLTSFADKKHKKLEKKVLSIADEVVTIGNTLGKELRELGAKNVHVITNGFDSESDDNKGVELDRKISIAHIGSMTKTRNPENLWKAISELITENDSLKDKLEIKLVGKVDIDVITSIESHGLKNILHRIDYLPHEEVVLEQKKTHILLLVINNTPNAKGILTGKVFEYMASGRPILAIGPKDGDVAEVFKQTNSGEVIDYDDFKGMKQFILEYLKSDRLTKAELPAEVMRFHRKSLTEDLVNLLND